MSGDDDEGDQQDRERDARSEGSSPDPSDPPASEGPPQGGDDEGPPSPPAYTFSEENPEPTDLGNLADADTNLGRETSGRLLSAWKCGAEIQGFRLLQELGSGATGIVYRAIKLETGQQVALKLLIRSHYRELTRLKRGFRAIVDVEHPHLLKLYELHQYQDRCFVTMEEIDGGPLFEVLKQEAISEVDRFYERVTSLLCQAAEALAALHRHSLVHRDIKPNNLLIDAAGNLRLIDYGLVGSFDPERDPDAHRGYLAGTREYMAPEVLLRQIYPPASDLYGLARVFTKLIRVRHPRRGEVQRASKAPLPVDAPPRLQSLFIQMLSKETSERPSASEVVSALREGDAPAPVRWQANQALPIVGRNAALDFVSAWLPRVVRGETRRLHIRGESGIGKSRFLNEVAARFSQNSWLQVFQSRCRLREDISMQAFDEIVDTLAWRYSRTEAPQLQLDPVNAELLRHSFPVLQPVLDRAKEVRRQRALRRSESADALLELTEQVCQHGPIILIIDDLQWADAASFVLIRRLQHEVQGQLAIITSSRSGFDPPDVETEDILELPPLDEEDAFQLLNTHLRLRQIHFPAEDVRKLARHSQGNPYHLLHLAACVASGDVASVQDWIADQSLDVRDLWMQRYRSLQPLSRTILTGLATAGGPVHESQLAAFCGLEGPLEATLAELRREQLVHDREESVLDYEISHNRIAEAVIRSLPADELAAAHRRWAEHLMALSSATVPAARIAWHLIACSDYAAALPHAVEAAEEAEGRFAFRDAGDWYLRVVALASPEQQQAYLEKAAACYVTGGRHRDAAEMFQRLAHRTRGEQADRYHAQAAEQFIRGGDVKASRQTLIILAQQLQLPQPKPWQEAIRQIDANFARLRQQGGSFLDELHGAPRDASEARIRTCLDLSRPLSMYDNLYATELATSAMLSLQQFGSSRDRLYGVATCVVFGSYDAGWWRQHSARLLPQVRGQAEQLNDPESQAHACYALGNHHWLQGQFADAVGPLQEAYDRYRNECQERVIDAVQTQMLVFWSHFFLGCLEELSANAATTFHDACDRDDLFTFQISGLAFAASAWLLRDDVAGLRKLTRNNRSYYRGVGIQLFHCFQMFGNVLRKLYLGQPAAAVRLLEIHAPSREASGLTRMQLGRVFWNYLSVNATIQLADRCPAERPYWLAAAAEQCEQLAAESLPFAQTLVALFRGRLAEADGDEETARQCYRDARDGAEQQQLRPFALAAEDGITRLQASWQAGERIDQLRCFFRAAGVINPQRFERLYIPPVEFLPQ